MIQFENGEQTVAIIRKHWIVFVVRALMLGILAPIPTLAVIGFRYIPDIPQFFIPGGVLVIITAVWILFLWILFFAFWTNTYLDLWIVTDRRIMDIEQIGLFHRTVTSFTYDKIQDIQVKTSGMIPTLFGFGTITIQTASTEGELVLPLIPKPEELRVLISNIQQKNIQSKEVLATPQ